MMPNPEKNHAMVDLHGSSVEEAKREVFYWIAHSARHQFRKIRFVTGRGNHVNAQGQRGTLFKEFLSWIKESPHQDRIEECKEFDGYFEVHLKPTNEISPQEQFVRTIANNPMGEAWLKQQIAYMKAEAEKGDTEYQVIYAEYLEDCEPGDYKQIYELYKKAAEKEVPKGMYHLGRCYYHGIGTRQNDEEAIIWFQKADKAGIIDATIALGNCYWNAVGGHDDPRMAVTYYAKAAAKKHPVALRKVASAYRQGIGITKNNKQAFIHYKESADLGDSISQYNIAAAYLNGEMEVQKDLKLGKHYLELSAKGGDLDAQFFLGQLLFTEGNQSEGLGWIKMAAENGSNAANTWLAFQLKDKTEQEQYVAKAAESGGFLFKLAKLAKERPNLSEQEYDNLAAQTIREAHTLSVNDIVLLSLKEKFMLLDDMLVTGKKPIAEKAFQALTIMADGGCIYSLRRLAYFNLYSSAKFQLKISIKKNPQKGIQFLKQGIKENDSQAMMLLGLIYRDGKFVKKSEEQAMALFQQAKALNNPAAYYYIAVANYNQMSTDPNPLTLINRMEQIISDLQQAIDAEAQKDMRFFLRSGFLDKSYVITPKAEELLRRMITAKAEFMQNFFTEFGMSYQEAINQVRLEEDARDPTPPKQSTTKILTNLSAHPPKTTPIQDEIILDDEALLSLPLEEPEYEQKQEAIMPDAPAPLEANVAQQEASSESDIQAEESKRDSYWCRIL